MKTIVLSSSIVNVSNGLRVIALASALFLAPALVTAKGSAPAADPAAQLLAASGSIAVNAAGPYVEVGTYRIQVSTKLGQPSARLADGTWLYRGFSVPESNARGTLVVRFEQGRVSQLSLVSLKVETALLTDHAKAKTEVAAK